MTKDIPPLPLPGEAPRGSIRALAGDGERVDPKEVIFPIVRQEPTGAWRLIGTGFFITDNGLFVSAKHVLLDVIDANNRQTVPIALLQFLPQDKYALRPILLCVAHDVADVAVGVAAPMTESTTGAPLENNLLTLTLASPAIGTRIATYAYPKTIVRPQEIHFYPTYFDGQVEEYFPCGRDQVLMPAPCFQTSMHIHGGASGGPVVGTDGAAFGVNSTGFAGTNCSYVSRIADVLPLRIPGVTTPRHVSPRSMTIRELAEDGFVIVRGAQR